MIEKNQVAVPTDEIDLVELIRIVWGKKWIVIKITSAFFLVGIAIAFTGPSEYKTTSVLIPEAGANDGKLGGSLGGLASLAGVDVGGLTSNSHYINPALYESVSKSTPFLLELMQENFHFVEFGQSMTLQEFYKEHYGTNVLEKIASIPSWLVNRISSQRSDQVNATESQEALGVTLSEVEYEIMEDLKKRVFVEMDFDLNIVTIEAEMQDPNVAAQMAFFTQEYITKYVTDYAISKGEKQLAQLEEQYAERKLEFETIQLLLASFRDRNQNVTTAYARSEQERLESEYSLAFNIYNQLAQQREALKLKIQEVTPVFTVLEPVKIPIRKSKPRRLLIITVSSFLGMISSVVFVFISSFLHKIT